jgi:hypothetical protein
MGAVAVQAISVCRGGTVKSQISNHLTMRGADRVDRVVEEAVRRVQARVCDANCAGGGAW